MEQIIEEYGVGMALLIVGGAVIFALSYGLSLI